MEKAKIIFICIALILGLIAFFKLKNKLKRDAYQKGEENRKKRYKK